MADWAFKHTYWCLKLDTKHIIDREILGIANYAIKPSVPNTQHFSNIKNYQIAVPYNLDELGYDDDSEEIVQAGFICFDMGKKSDKIREKFGPEILYVCLRNIDKHTEKQFAFIEDNFVSSFDCLDLTKRIVEVKLRSTESMIDPFELDLNDFPIIALYQIQKAHEISNCDL